MIPTLFISGQSNTGKTTLIGKIINNLSTLGLTIAVLKHSSSKISGESEGKDTFTYRTNGAVATAVAGENLTAIFHHGHVIENPVRLAQSIFRKQNYELTGSPTKHYAGSPQANLSPTPEKTIDLILIEGYKSLNYPKIALPQSKEDTDSFRGAIAYVLPEEILNKAPLDEEVDEDHSNANTTLLCGKPLFCRDRPDKISEFIHSWWQNEICSDKTICTVALSDGLPLPINEYTAITLNKMIRGLLSELRGYEEDLSFTIDCSQNEVKIYSIGTLKKLISVKPFIAEMINHSTRGFLSSLKDTKGRLSNFIIEIAPVL